MSGGTVRGMSGEGVIMSDDPDNVYVSGTRGQNVSWYGEWPISETSILNEAEEERLALERYKLLEQRIAKGLAGEAASAVLANAVERKRRMRNRSIRTNDLAGNSDPIGLSSTDHASLERVKQFIHMLPGNIPSPEEERNVAIILDNITRKGGKP